MVPRLDDLYLRLPSWAQNLALDIKGRHERRIRFGTYYEAFTREVATRRCWSRAQLVDFQLGALNQLIGIAARHVPFYRGLYARSVDADVQLQSFADLAGLPVVNKAMLRERNADFRDPRLHARDIIHIKTTGTTGMPVTVFTTARARQLNYAYYNDFLTAVGVKPFGRRIVIGGRVIMSAADQHAPYWRFSRSTSTMYMSSYHISRATAAVYAQAINDWSAEYIDAYPSSLWILAGLLRDAGLKVKPPRALITSSETLYPEQRKLIEGVFGSMIYDQYGAREMCMFVGQCRSGRYHVRPDYGIVEIRNNGREALPGEMGDVLCTGFVNPAMPLIRYSIGDLAAWAVDQQCDCASTGPIVERIVGRQDDAIVCPDGRRVGRLSPLLKGFPVREAQYIQRELGVLIVRLVRAQGYSERDTEAIRVELRRRLGNEMKFEFDFVEAVPRGRGGKYRVVISDLDRRS